MQILDSAGIWFCCGLSVMGMPCCLRRRFATCPPVQEPLLLWTLVGVVAGVVLGVALKPAGLGPQVRLPGCSRGHARFMLQQ